MNISLITPEAVAALEKDLGHSTVGLDNREAWHNAFHDTAIKTIKALEREFIQEIAPVKGPISWVRTYNAMLLCAMDSCHIYETVAYIYREEYGIRGLRKLAFELTDWFESSHIATQFLSNEQLESEVDMALFIYDCDFKM